MVRTAATALAAYHTDESSYDATPRRARAAIEPDPARGVRGLKVTGDRPTDSRSPRRRRSGPTFTLTPRRGGSRPRCVLDRGPRRLCGRRGNRLVSQAARSSDALEHDLQRQRLVADVVEQHDDRVVVVALHDALAPLARGRPARRRRTGVGGAAPPRPARVAVVAVAARAARTARRSRTGRTRGGSRRSRRRRASCRRASGRTRAGAPGRGRRLDRGRARRRVRGWRDRAVGEHLDRARLLEPDDRRRELRLRSARSPPAARPARAARRPRRRPASTVRDLLQVDLAAAGEEAAQAEVLGAVEQDAPRPARRRGPRGRSPGSRRRATRRRRRGGPSARSALSTPMPNAVVATTTSSSPSMKRSCDASRSAPRMPAW